MVAGNGEQVQKIQQSPEQKAKMAAYLKSLEAARAKGAAMWEPYLDCNNLPPMNGGEIVDYLFDTHASVFSDVGGNTWLRWKKLPECLRNLGGHKNVEQEQGVRGEEPEPDCLVPLPSRQARALISAWIHLAEFGALKPGALNEALLILEGMALVTRESCDLGTAVEVNPVLDTLLALLAETPEWDGSATDLLAALGKLSQERGWNFERRGNWPKDPSQLSRAVGKLEKFLQDAGFTHEYSRSGGCRSHRFSPRETAGNKSCDSNTTVPNSISPASSDTPHSSATGAASAPEKTAPTHDGSDGVLTSPQTPSPVPSSANSRSIGSSVTSDGSDGVFAAAVPTQASSNGSTDWKRPPGKRKKKRGRLLPLAR